MLGGVTSHHLYFGSRFFCNLHIYCLVELIYLEPYSYSGWRRFLFRWCIRENFSLKGSLFLSSYIRVFTVFSKD